MTDWTRRGHEAMSDQTHNGYSQRGQSPSIEYRIYFAIIFLISLPWAFVSWALGLEMPDCEDKRTGFICRAWHQASVITPLIFSK